MASNKGAGRPPLSDYEKMRRKAHKSYIKVKKAHEAVISEVSFDFVEFASSKDGRPSLSVGEIYDRAKKDFNESLNALNRHEKSYDLPVSSIEDVKILNDPAVANGRIEIGRPAKNELDKMDHQLRYLDRQIARIELEPDVAEEELGRTGGRGRPKTTRSERLAYYELENQSVRSKIKTLESKLEGVPKAERELKKARDLVRLTKADIKKASDDLKSELASKLEKYEESVTSLAYKLKVEKTRVALREEMKTLEGKISTQNDSHAVDVLNNEYKALERKLNRYDYQSQAGAYDEHLMSKV